MLPLSKPKETTMLYKTIILELLQQRPQIHEKLRQERKLLPTLEKYARELKASHEIWKEILSQAIPESAKSQLSSEAMEIALQEMEHRLSLELPPSDSEPLSLDAAMAFLRKNTPQN
jgi:hypothetical protein